MGEPLSQIRFSSAMVVLLQVPLLLLVVREAMGDKVVMTSSGPLQGITLDWNTEYEVEAYLGIPYAEPPVGRLRFHRTVPKSSWVGVYDASKKPPPCIQDVEEKYYYMPDGENMTEDCLYLNIWIPRSASKNNLKPIIVWIHGGAYNIGSSDMWLYDGATLANYGDVMVASFNYRIGVFGFLSAGISDANGNMGLYDQLEALKWIKSNARSFGGDPDQMTLMGESAGAMSIAGFLTSPMTKHLFKRVILQSGGAIHPLIVHSNERLFMTAQKLAKSVRCADKSVGLNEDPQRVVNCLKSLPAEELARAEGGMRRSAGVTFYPRTGDEFLPKSPVEYLREGEFMNTEMLTGVNKNEGTFFLTAILPQFFGVYGINNIQSISKRVAFQMTRAMYKMTEQTEEAKIAEFYINDLTNATSDGYTKAIGQSLGDYMVTCNSIFHADFHSLKDNPVYFYTFTHRSTSTPLAQWMGVTHFDEVQYVFGNPIRETLNYTEEELILSKRMMDRWLTFAKTGDPNIPGAIKWPRYTYEDPEYLDIDIEESVRLRPDDYRCEFWRSRFLADIDEALVEQFRSCGSIISLSIHLMVFLASTFLMSFSKLS